LPRFSVARSSAAAPEDACHTSPRPPQTTGSRLDPRAASSASTPTRFGVGRPTGASRPSRHRAVIGASRDGRSSGSSQRAAAAEPDAESLTDELAKRLAASGTSIAESVALFVAARRPFLAELGAIGRRRSLDPARLSAAYEDASALLDRLLLRLMATHEASMR